MVQDVAFAEITYVEKQELRGEPSLMLARDFDMDDQYDDLYDSVADVLHAGIFRRGLRLYRDNDVKYTFVEIDSFLFVNYQPSTDRALFKEAYVATVLVDFREAPLYVLIFLGTSREWEEERGHFSVILRATWREENWQRALSNDVDLHSLD